MKKFIQIMIVILALGSEWAAFSYYYDYRQGNKGKHYLEKAKEYLRKYDSSKTSIDSLNFIDSANKYNYKAQEAYDLQQEFK